MNKQFNPLDYTDYQAPVLISQEKLNLSDTDKIYRLVEHNKFYLRDNHGSLFTKALLDPELRKQVKLIISDYIKENVATTFDAPLDHVIAKVQQEVTELGNIQEALDDPTITNIDINGLDKVYVEQNGQERYMAEIVFQSEDHLYQIIDKMLLPMGKSLTASEPHIDSQYEGFRICAVLGKNRGGVSTFGPIISIRKFAPDVFTDQEVISYGNISQEIRDFLADLVPGGANILVAGSTNSGKTTTLIRLPLYLKPDTRIITIEDSPEMMLPLKKAYQAYKNMVCLENKKHEKAARAYDIAKLTGVSLRLRPSWIIIGEVRFAEAASQALVAMNTGHSVAMTIHANSAAEGAIRLVQLAGNTPTVAAQVASSVDLIIFQKKLSNGKRVILEIAELTGYQGAEEPVFNYIFKYDLTAKVHRRVGNISASLANKLLINNLTETRLERWTKG